MKKSFQYMFLCLSLTLLVSGCYWLNPINENEGEGEAPVEGEVSEGEMLLEGEVYLEGEVEGESAEGEGEIESEGEETAEGEGEDGKVEFTSADTGGYYRDYFGEEIPIAEPDDGTNEGEETREVVEPDVIRRVGDLLYVLNQYRGLSIVDLDDEKLLSQTPTVGYPRDLYLAGDLAYVLVSYAQDVTFEEDSFRVQYGSKLYVFNIADPEHVVPQGVFNFDGDLVDSRLVGSVLYAVCSDYSWYEGYGEGAVIDTGAAEKSYGATWAISVNIADPESVRIVDTVQFEGYGNLIQATNNAIFSASNDYSTNNTRITYIDIEDPEGDMIVRATVLVPGYMADRYKMDAWNGALRVVTNAWDMVRNTYITTFDITDPDTMAQLGQTVLENASGETTYATRFDGARAYIVTYLTVDPLFVLDLSNPADPKVTGELIIPGWSTHIEPRGNRLIALGVDDQDGRRVMVSLFDVTNPANPQRLDYASFGERWSWSEAYGDVKAFTVLDDMILVPFSGWNDGSGGYDRLQFISYDADALAVQGYVDLQGSALRSFRDAGLYYAVTREHVAVIDAGNLAAPEIVNSVTLAENVADVAPLSNGWAVEVVTRYDSADTLLRAIDAEGQAGGSLLLPLAGVTETLAWKDTVIIVSGMYTYEPEYKGYHQVVRVDFSDPEAPQVTGKWEVQLEPWYGGWWWGPYMPMVDVAVPTPEKRVSYYWGYSVDASALLAGDYLVLRGRGSVFDTVLGPVTPWEGLAVINLSAENEITYVGLGFEVVQSVGAGDGLVYITTRESRALNAEQRPVCAFYLQTLDPATLEMDESVNVPGIFTGSASGGDLLVLEDPQYGAEGGLVTLLRCGRINGKAFTLTDSFTLPFVYGDVAMDDRFIGYLGNAYDYYYPVPVLREVEEGESVVEPPVREPGYVLGALTLSTEGLFESQGELGLGQTWCTLLGVRKSQAFMTVSGAAVAQCVFSESDPEVLSVSPVMGYPASIRFSAQNAHIPLGYSGVLTLPL